MIEHWNYRIASSGAEVCSSLAIARPRAAFFRLLLPPLLLQPLIVVVGGASSVIRRRFYGSEARSPAARLPVDVMATAGR